jgi:2-oxoglutarate ferredoxin oxidoreductase subunit beta
MDHPFSPVSLALGAGPFIGRAVTPTQGPPAVLGAAAHRGTALTRSSGLPDLQRRQLRRAAQGRHRPRAAIGGAAAVRAGPAGDDGLGTYAVVREGFRMRVAKTIEWTSRNRRARRDRP